jgi:hypothetical protein
MLNWLKKYWPALLLSALLIAILDGMISSLITCHPIADQANGTANTQEQEECTALAGPLLLSAAAIVNFLDKHGEAVTGVFTVFLAVFTGRLWWSTDKLWRQTKESVDLARNEFLSSHRPELRLKLIWLASADGQRFDPRLEGGRPITVRLDIVNIGRNAALVYCTNFVAIVLPFGQRLPQRPPYNDEATHQFFKTYLGNFRLESGITLQTHATDTRHPPTIEDIREIREGTRRLYCVGVIEYSDDAGRPRQTAFCRYLTFGSYPPGPRDAGRFQKEKDPDYEYQD